jgi:hypothetical protein
MELSHLRRDETAPKVGTQRKGTQVDGEGRSDLGLDA